MPLFSRLSCPLDLISRIEKFFYGIPWALATPVSPCPALFLLFFSKNTRSLRLILDFLFQISFLEELFLTALPVTKNWWFQQCCVNLQCPRGPHPPLSLLIGLPNSASRKPGFSMCPNSSVIVTEHINSRFRGELFCYHGIYILVVERDRKYSTRWQEGVNALT